MAITLGIMLATASGVIHLSCIGIILFTSSKFNRYKGFQAIQKRWPKLVQLMSIGIILYLIHQIIYKFSFIYDGSIEGFYQTKSIGNILKVINLLVYLPSIHGMNVTLIARSWLVYFNIKYAIQIKVSTNLLHQ